MKRIILLAGMFIVAIALAACGNTDNNDDASGDQDTGMENTEDQDNNANENADDNQADSEDTDTDNAADNNEEDGDMKQKMNELDYTDFELEVDYGKDKEYEAEIEQDIGKVKADLEDELNGDDINGQEAFDKIYPNVKKLNIDQNTEKADAIQQTLDAFDLDSNYVKFEVEITFKDGTKIEFEDRK